MEYFCRASLNDNATHIESVKHIILPGLVVHEQLQVFEDPLFNRHSVVVPDGVLTQEIKLHHILLVLVFLVQSQMFLPEGTTTNSVGCLSFLLLVTCSQGKLRKEVL